MKRHPMDPLSFVLGAFFLVTGLVFAFGGDASKMHVVWFWPVVLGVTGLGLMLLTVRSVRPEGQTVAAVEPATGTDARPIEPVTLEDEQDEPGHLQADLDEPGPAEPGPNDFDR